MTHLTTSELAAWRDGHGGAARDRVVDHLAACGGCAARYADLVRAHAPESPPARFDPAAFAARGAMVFEEKSRLRSTAGRGALIALAAAAAVVLAVWLPSTRGRDTASTPPPAAPPAAAVRGSRPQPMSPSGTTTLPLEFRWASPLAADRYLVEVKDASGARVFAAETRNEQVQTGDAQARLLQSGEAYTWTVTALDGAGDAIATSDPMSFAVAGR